MGVCGVLWGVCGSVVARWLFGRETGVQLARWGCSALGLGREDRSDDGEDADEAQEDGAELQEVGVETLPEQVHSG